MEVDAREAVLGPKGLQKKSDFLVTGTGLVRPVLRVGALRRRKKTKKRSETKKSKKKKICTTVGWVDALLGGLGSSRLKARVACQKG